MKKIILVALLISQFSYAQDNKKIWSKFINITEVGFTAGRVRYNTDTWSTSPSQYNVVSRLSPTLQTFNGFQLKPKTAVGLTVGLDIYQNTMLMPIALGIRQTLIEKPNKKTQLIASLDAGFGTNLLQLDKTDQVTHGGLMVNPMLGYRIPNRGGSSWLLNFGYKTQYATVDKTTTFEEFNSQEERIYNRFVFRLGFQF